MDISSATNCVMWSYVLRQFNHNSKSLSRRYVLLIVVVTFYREENSSPERLKDLLKVSQNKGTGQEIGCKF